MDSNNILQSLANLRDALQGIESAKQQVTENVAAYEKVRSQLSDTADSVSEIVSEIQTLIKDVQITQSSFTDKLNLAASQILDELKSKGENITAESEHLLGDLEIKLKKVTSGIELAVDTATSQLNELSEGKQQEIASIVHTVDKSLKDAVSEAQKELDSISADFNQKSEHHLSNIERFVDAQLKKLSSGVETHLSSYAETETKIQSQVEEIRNQASAISQTASDMVDKITSLLADNEEKLSQSLTSISDSIINAGKNNKKDLSNELAEIASQQKNSTEGAQAAVIVQLKTTQEALISKVDVQAEMISSLVKSNRTMTIVSIVLMVILLVLSFLK